MDIDDRCRNEMRDDAHEDKADVGTRLMQTYVDDSGQDNAANGGAEAGSGLPEVA